MAPISYNILCLLLFALLTHALLSERQETHNTTVALPNGYSLINSGSELCLLPTPWYQYGTFYLGNYFLHAATVRRPPGMPLHDYLLLMLGALLVPSSGFTLGFLTCTRGIQAYIIPEGFRFWDGLDMLKSWCSIKDWIFLRGKNHKFWKFWTSKFWHYWLKGDDSERKLHLAQQVGALCMVIRKLDWQLSSEDHQRRQEELLDIENVYIVDGNLPTTPEPRAPENATRGMELNRMQEPNNQPPPSGMPEPNNQLSLAQVLIYSPACLSKSRRSLPPILYLIWSMIVDVWYCLRRIWKGKLGLSTKRQLELSLDEIRMVESGYRVYGFDWKDLPPGYALAIVPHDAKLALDKQKPCPIAPVWSAGRAFVAILQALYATFTVVRSAQGNQLEKYGYAAFGLTVLPYALMSIINLFANFFCPTFDSLYLVDSSVLREAQERFQRKLENQEKCLAYGLVAKLSDHGLGGGNANGPVNEDGQQNRNPGPGEPPNGNAEQDGAMHQGGDGDGLEARQIGPSRLLGDGNLLDRLIASNYLAASTVSDEAYWIYWVFHFPRLLILLPTRRPRNLHPELLRDHAGPMAQALPKLYRSDVKNAPDRKTLDKGVWKFISDTRPITKILVPRCQSFELDDDKRTKHPRFCMLLRWIAFWVIVGLPFIIIGALTRYRGNSSTTMQRIIIMLWIAVGQVAGVGLAVGRPLRRFFSADQFLPTYRFERIILLSKENSESMFKDWKSYVFRIVLYVLIGTPSIWGLVLVGLMIRDTGSCTVLYH